MGLRLVNGLVAAAVAANTSTYDNPSYNDSSSSNATINNNHRSHNSQPNNSTHIQHTSLLSTTPSNSNPGSFPATPATAATAATTATSDHTTVNLSIEPALCDAEQVHELFRRALNRNYRHIVAELLHQLESAHVNGYLLASWAGLNFAEIESNWCPPSFVHVAVLDLSRNRLTALPTTFLRALPQLRNLDISHNALIRLPSDRIWRADDWPFLTVLRVGHNQLTMIPQFVTQLSALKVLDLRSNQLNILPSIWHTPALTEIDVTDNNLDALPIALLQSPKLVVLAASQNRITTMPVANKWQCRRLRTLDLRGNTIDIPGLLSELSVCCPDLEILRLANTFVSSLPSA